MDSQGPDPAGIQGGSPLQQLHLFHRCFTSLLTPSHGPAYAASAELGGGGRTSQVATCIGCVSCWVQAGSHHDGSRQLIQPLPNQVYVLYAVQVVLCCTSGCMGGQFHLWGSSSCWRCCWRVAAAQTSTRRLQVSRVVTHACTGLLPFLPF